MRQVRTNAELEALHDAGDGLIFNDFGSTAAQDNILHTASCTWVRRMLLNSDPSSAPSVRKYFFRSIDEADSWLTSNRGPVDVGWKLCRTCEPGDRNSDHVPRAASRTDGRHLVFREAEVEQLLYAHLGQAGYDVRQQVRVPCGFVDAVAVKDDERIVIEAKGEDSGGLGSAQMNLLMAFGQISSRMTDPDAVYAIVFPDSSDYRKALRAFRDRWRSSGSDWSASSWAATGKSAKSKQTKPRHGSDRSRDIGEERGVAALDHMLDPAAMSSRIMT